MKQIQFLPFLLLITNASPTPILGSGSLPDLLGSLFPGLLDPDDGSDIVPGPSPDPDPGSTSEPIPSLQGYALTWHDEFTYQSLDSSTNNNNENNDSHLPHSSNWIFDTGTSYPSGASNWGNNELQTYTTSPSNIRVTESNTLQIIPRYEANTGTGTGTGEGEGHWTSARIETTDSTFHAFPGQKLYIESRLRTGCAPPEQQHGIWPAFWALGASFRADPTHWPMASEWDIVEVVNGEPTVYNTVHCGTETREGGPCNEYTGLGNGGVGWGGCDWHVVGFEVDRSAADGGGGGGGGRWEEEMLRWFLDGEQVHTVSGADVGDEQVWESVAHQGHFLLLNVAVGGNWPGYPDENTLDGEDVALEVDYVRVWNSLDS